MWKTGWGNFKKMEGEGWRRILCGGAVGQVWNGGGRMGTRRRGAAKAQRGNRKKVERWCGKTERGYGSAEDIVRRGREGVQRGYWGMGTRWRGGAEWRRNCAEGCGEVRNGGGYCAKGWRNCAEEQKENA